MSTEDFQDPATSRQWQYDTAEVLAAGHGRIVAEYFDVGYTRRRGWANRPRAAALLAALPDQERGFDAVVVGETVRVFYGRQLLQLAPTFAAHKVPLWLPEVHGPLDLTDPGHQAVVMGLGAQSRKEVLRALARTTAAMRAQTRDQGRYLGGRPPYGYRLADAGPHPNKADAKWGRRLQRLEPDPVTAGHVRWMFAQRLAGASYSGIARELNEIGVPCPSAVDPVRNLHRDNEFWSLRTVASILGNPRYTGRQVWNKQRKHYPAEDDLEARMSDRQPPRQWNQQPTWVISHDRAHDALVSEQDFVAAQAVRAVPEPEDGSIRTYLLAGLLRCAPCGRRMESHWVNNRPGYRCRHGANSATPVAARQQRILYLREDHLLDRLHIAARHGGPLSALTGELGTWPTGEQVAQLLRRDQHTIVCTPDQQVVEPGGHRIWWRD